MGMILRIASSRIVGQGDIVGRSGYFSLNLSANSVMRGRLDARRTLKSLVADLRKNKKETVRISGYKVNAVDTTAAGDTFCGALAVACSQRGLDREALEFANVAAAIAVTRMGAQPSIPTLEEVGRFRLEREISLSFNL